MANTYTWNVVATTLKAAALCTPAPASSVLGVIGNLASLTSGALEARAVSKKNPLLIDQLLERALILSSMLERSYVAECRPQDEVFGKILSSYKDTMVDVLGFARKSPGVHQGLIRTVLTGSAFQIQSDVADLCKRLDTVMANYTLYLLIKSVSKGPAEGIEHPQLRGFWIKNFKDNVGVKLWVDFWEKLKLDFPDTREFLSGQTASKNKEILQARALPRDPKFVGPSEINNLFQPPGKSVGKIISTVLAGDVDHEGREAVSAIGLGAGRQPIPSYGSTRAAREVQTWSGYWKQGSHRGVMTLELFFGANHRIAGGGSDEVGLFTITGEHGGTKVNFAKQYIGEHQVQYEGQIRNNTVRGNWTMRSLFLRTGSFHLEQKTRESVANGVEGAIVQIGEMQHWTGYFEQKGKRSKMSGDVLFTDTQNIYGNGVDDIGGFTWFGRYQQKNHSTIVKMTKQYDRNRDRQHPVYYMGAIRHSLSFKVVMEGSWVFSKSSDQDSGKFFLQLGES